MRRSALLSTTLLILLGGSNAWAADDDVAAKVAAQKWAAKTNWAMIEAGEPAVHESDHVLIYAHKSYEKRVKDVAASLEKALTQIKKALQFEQNTEPLVGKLTVYLLTEREQFTSFI